MLKTTSKELFNDIKVDAGLVVEQNYCLPLMHFLLPYLQIVILLICILFLLFKSPNILFSMVFAFQDNDSVRYHVILGDQLFPKNLKSGVHKSTMLGLSYWLMFYKNASQVIMSENCVLILECVLYQGEAEVILEH